MTQQTGFSSQLCVTSASSASRRWIAFKLKIGLIRVLYQLNRTSCALALSRVILMALRAKKQLDPLSPTDVMVKKSHAVEIEERFNAVVEEFGILLRRAIVRYCPHDKGLQFDDIEQEARMRLWRALQAEREVADYASYLYRIAATATIDAMRRIQARHEEQLDALMEQRADEGEIMIVPAPVKDSPERLTESREAVRKVMSVVAKLPDEQRRAVGMYLQGMTSQDVADLMGWTEPKSRNLIYRGLKELRKLLREEGIDYEIE